MLSGEDIGSPDTSQPVLKAAQICPEFLDQVPVDIILLLLVAAIWGSAFTTIKIAVMDMGALWTATVRVFIGFLAVLPFAFLKPALPGSVKVWGLTFAVAMLSMVLPFVMISWAMKHVPAGVGSLLLGTTPFIAIVIGHFATRDERITPLKLLGVLFAVSGTGLFNADYLSL